MQGNTLRFSCGLSMVQILQYVIHKKGMMLFWHQSMADSPWVTLCECGHIWTHASGNEYYECVRVWTCAWSWGHRAKGDCLFCEKSKHITVNVQEVASRALLETRHELPWHLECSDDLRKHLKLWDVLILACFAFGLMLLWLKRIKVEFLQCPFFKCWL